MDRDLDAGQRQHRGAEVDRTDQVVADPSPAQVRPSGDQRHVNPRVVRPALAAGQGTVVAPVEHVRVVREPVFFQLLEQGAELPVVMRDVRIHAGQGRPDLRRVGQVRRRRDVIGIEFRRRALLRPHPAFVTAHEVEDREERLVRVGAVAPVGGVSEVVPGRHRRIELVVGLEVVRAIVTSPPQILGEALDVVGRDRGIGRGHFRGIGVYVGGPHVVCSDGNGVHPGDDRGPGRGADPGSGIALRPPATPGREAVHVRRAGHRVAVAAVAGPGVFEGNPQDVRSGSGMHAGLSFFAGSFI